MLRRPTPAQATGEVSDEEDGEQQLESIALGGAPLDAVPEAEAVQVRAAPICAIGALDCGNAAHPAKCIADVLCKPEGSCHLPAYLHNPLPQGASAAAHGRMGRLSLDRPSSAGSEQQQPGSPHGVLGALKKTGAQLAGSWREVSDCHPAVSLMRHSKDRHV